MKKILSIFLIFVLSLCLVGCDDSGAIPYNYDASESLAKVKELAQTTGFVIEYSYFADELGGSKKAKYYSLDDYDDYDDWDYGYDYDDYDYDDDITSMNITIGIKGDIYYMASGSAAMYLDFSDSSKVTIYQGAFDNKINDYKWNKDEEVYSYGLDRSYYESQFGANLYTYLIPSSQISSSIVTSRKTDAICGRLCDAITLVDSSSKSDDEVKLYIDQEYGICLGMETTEIEKIHVYTVGMKATRFDTFASLNLPSV